MIWVMLFLFKHRGAVAQRLDLNFWGGCFWRGDVLRELLGGFDLGFGDGFLFKHRGSEARRLVLRFFR